MNGGPRIYCDSRYCLWCGLWGGHHRWECPAAPWNQPKDERADACEEYEKERLK